MSAQGPCSYSSGGHGVPARPERGISLSLALPTSLGVRGWQGVLLQVQGSFGLFLILLLEIKPRAFCTELNSEPFL